jgi:hypothetical protein
MMEHSGNGRRREEEVARFWKRFERGFWERRKWTGAVQ